MSGSEIAVSTFEATRALSKELAASQLLPQALKQKPADVLAIVLTGRELGLEPMQAIRGIHIIEGKPSMSADLMGALVKKSPACEFLTLVESTGLVATYKTKRRGEPGETVMSFTIEQAKAAGAEGKSNWKKYPDAMLRARALAAICRAVYPDVCLGIYDSDSGELEPALVVRDDAPAVEDAKAKLKAARPTDVIEGEVVPSTKTTIGGLTVDVDAGAKEVNEAPDAKKFSPAEVWAARFAQAVHEQELRGLVPELKALEAKDPAAAATLKPLFAKRRAELTAGAR